LIKNDYEFYNIDFNGSEIIGFFSILKSS